MDNNRASQTVLLIRTSDKNFAWEHGKFSEPLAGKVFSEKMVLDLLKVFDNVD